MDERATEIRDALKELSWGISDFIREFFKAYPKHSGIHSSTIYRFINGESTEKRRKWVNDGLAVLRKSLADFSTQNPHLEISRQNSSNISNLDSALRKQAVEMSIEIEIKAILASPGSPWSAKSETYMIRVGGAFPGAAGLPVQLEEKLGNIYAGSVLIFKPVVTNYPKEGVILLFEGYNDPDSRLIGWIDSNSGSKIQTAGKDQSLTDWKPTHYAFAVMWGADRQLTDTKTSTSGISPRVTL